MGTAVPCLFWAMSIVATVAYLESAIAELLLDTKHNTPPPCRVERSLPYKLYLPDESVIPSVTEEASQLSVTDRTI